MEGWTIILVAVIMTALVCVASKAIVGNYFREKERFVDRLVKKQKGKRDGTRE